MTRRAVTLQHAVAVAKNFDTVVAVKAATFGIGDTFIRL